MSIFIEQKVKVLEKRLNELEPLIKSMSEKIEELEKRPAVGFDFTQSKKSDKKWKTENSAL